MRLGRGTGGQGTRPGGTRKPTWEPAADGTSVGDAPPAMREFYGEGKRREGQDGACPCVRVHGCVWGGWGWEGGGHVGKGCLWCRQARLAGAPARAHPATGTVRGRRERQGQPPACCSGDPRHRPKTVVLLKLPAAASGWSASFRTAAPHPPPWPRQGPPARALASAPSPPAHLPVGVRLWRVPARVLGVLPQQLRLGGCHQAGVLQRQVGRLERGVVQRRRRQRACSSGGRNAGQRGAAHAGEGQVGSRAGTQLKTASQAQGARPVRVSWLWPEPVQAGEAAGQAGNRCSTARHGRCLPVSRARASAVACMRACPVAPERGPSCLN